VGRLNLIMFSSMNYVPLTYRNQVRLDFGSTAYA
jgi:hypothetical protein